MRRRAYLIFFLICFFTAVNAQKMDTNSVIDLCERSRICIDNEDYRMGGILARQADSISRVLKYDKGEAHAENGLGLVFLGIGKYDSARFFLNMALEKFIVLRSKKKICAAYNNIGLTFDYQGNYAEALKYYEKAYSIMIEMGQLEPAAKALQNMGVVYWLQSNFTLAIDYYFKALKLGEKINNKLIIADCLINLGLVYSDLKSPEKALDYLYKGLKICKEIKNKKSESACYQNIGNIFKSQNKNAEARDQYLKALEIETALNDQNGIGSSLDNIGLLFQSEGDNDKALEYFFNSLTIRKTIGDKNGIATCLDNIAGVYFIKKQYDNALKYALEGNALGHELNSKEKLMSSYECLYRTYAAKGKTDLAFANYKKFIEARDSIFNEETTRRVTQSEMQFVFDKKTEIDSVKNVEHALLEKIKHNEEIKQQRIYSYGGIIGCIFMLIVAAISFRAFKNKQKANKIISEQKVEVENQKILIEEHQKDIIDSINYAKRIQQAILPAQKFIKEYLPDSFILFKPKDIVAGDFYWMHTVSGQKPESLQTVNLPTAECILIAAADCTGHGVPGAMVSVVCSNALNRSVNEFGLTDPGKILDKTRDLVLETFSKSDKDVKDGMDISLLSISAVPEAVKLPKGRLVIPKGQSFSNVTESFKKYKIQWAGANNPLWYYKNGGLNEITAHKQPIGKTDNPTPFRTHTFELSKGDILYLFTDGYADQFGGEKGKKFKYKQLKELLNSNNSASPDEQEKILNLSFENWKGNLEQVDDVCIIGIRV